MEINKLVFGGLALGCLTAAAGGGYLAARQTAAPPAPVLTASPSSELAPLPVTESEGLIAPEPTAPPAAVEPAEVPRAAAPAAAPRRETAPRAAARPAPAPARASSPAAPAWRSARAERPAEAAPEPVAAPAPAPTTGGMWEPRPTVAPERTPIYEVDPTPPAPAAPELVELVIPSDSVLGLQIERTITSDTARVEDRVEARVTRDVRVGDRVAIPAGSLVHGSVFEVDRGGKVREKARLGIRFHTVVLADGTRLNVRTDPVMREGASPARESAAKIGGAAVGGAILGAILGGGKGAVIGGATGAAGGTAATMAGDRNPAILPAGSTVSVRVQQPVAVTVEKFDQ